MPHELDDLLPLFCGEARGRIERMLLLAPDVEHDAEAAQKVRRELHALKGATRMMRMTELSDLCHQGEELLNPPAAGSSAALVALLDRLTAGIAAFESPTPSEPVPSSATAPEAARPTRASEPPASRTGADAEEVRISNEVLDRLADRGTRMRILAVGASGLNDRLRQIATLAEKGVNEELPHQVLATLATTLRHFCLELESEHRSLYHLADRQLDTVLGLQVQPLRPFLLNLARHARELARSLGKELDAEVDAGETALDRRIIDALREAFLHLVRNAVDHGTEAPEKRMAMGKPRRATLRLGAYSEGARVRIEVRDDGSGVDLDAVLSAATRKGLVSQEDASRMSVEDVTRLLFLPGFSTKQVASDVSGRGVGLDAVATAVRGVGGDVWVASTPDQGTTVTIDVPVARRGERVLVVQVGRSQVALPAAVVRRFRRPAAGELISEGGRAVLRSGEQLIPVRVLAESLGETLCEDPVVIEGVAAGTTQAVAVDGVHGEEEVILRALPPLAGAPALFDSMAVLASGRAVPVVSPHRLGSWEVHQRAPLEQRAGGKALRVLLVDDCLVTREMVRRLLEDGGFAVTPAGSAGEALRILGEQPFDCVVTDIEMPEMDGLELTRHLRQSARFAPLPVVVVSTRDQPEDRLAGLEAGADAYLTKQTLDAQELVSLIHRVGGTS